MQIVGHRKVSYVNAHEAITENSDDALTFENCKCNVTFLLFVYKIICVYGILKM